MKLNQHVKFSSNIDLSQHTTANNKLVYQLYGVIIHKGLSLESGHYYSYVRNDKNHKWYKMNDTSVLEVHKDEVLSAQAYMLFFKHSPGTYLSKHNSTNNFIFYPQITPHTAESCKNQYNCNETNNQPPNQVHFNNPSGHHQVSCHQPKLHQFRTATQLQKQTTPHTSNPTPHQYNNIQSENAPNKTSTLYHTTSKVNATNNFTLAPQNKSPSADSTRELWTKHKHWNEKMLFHSSYRKKALRKLQKLTISERIELQSRGIDQSELEYTAEPLDVEGIIYAILHVPSYKIYAGRSINSAYNRFKRHWNQRFELEGRSGNLHRAMSRQTVWNFLIWPLEKIDVALYTDKNGRNRKAFDRAASVRERAWILKLQSLFPRGFNRYLPLQHLKSR